MSRCDLDPIYLLTLNICSTLINVTPSESDGSQRRVDPTARRRHRAIIDAHRILVVSRYTEIPNRYPIFSNIDTDTDVGILNTEDTEIPTSEYRKYRKFGSVFSSWSCDLCYLRFQVMVHFSLARDECLTLTLSLGVMPCRYRHK